MNRMSRAEKKINKIYCQPAENAYSHSFFQDFSERFSYDLAEKASRREFFSFEPKNCKVKKLLETKLDYDISHSIEQIAERAMYSLMAYGKAYIYINAEYANDSHEQNEAERGGVSSLEIEEIKGIIKKKTTVSTLFLAKGFREETFEKKLDSRCLIVLDIRDMGFRKKYFTKLVRKLGKYDITQGIRMLSKDKGEYDFDVHSKRSKKKILKATKDIGWSMGTDGLSDSYILFKQMQMNTLKIKVLNYIVNGINKSLRCICGKEAGKLIVNIRDLNYDRIWNEYQDGEITVTELSNILHQSS